MQHVHVKIVYHNNSHIIILKMNIVAIFLTSLFTNYVNDDVFRINGLNFVISKCTNDRCCVPPIWHNSACKICRTFPCAIQMTMLYCHSQLVSHPNQETGIAVHFKASTTGISARPILLLANLLLLSNGGLVEFHGLRGSSEPGTLLGTYQPVLGMAIIHAGRHFHYVTPVTSGNRYTIYVIWARLWKGARAHSCPCCWLN
jgi:hypothetical protein